MNLLMPSHSPAIQSLSYWAVAADSDGHNYQMVYQNDQGEICAVLVDAVVLVSSYCNEDLISLK